MADAHSDPLILLVKERGLIDDLQLEEVVQEHDRTGKSFGEILKNFGLVDQDTQLQIISEYIGTEVVDLRSVTYTPELLATVPSNTARMYQCVPVAEHGNTLQVALGDPLNPSALDELGFIVRRELNQVVADPAQIARIIEQHYGTEMENVGDILKELEKNTDLAKEAAEAAEGNEADLGDLANEVPIVRFVNLVLFQAIQDRASDIHFEPFEDEFKIRYRVDGALYEMAPPPKHLALPVISRLKVMANLNIAERRLPQDGRITVPIGNKLIDLLSAHGVR